MVISRASLVVASARMQNRRRRFSCLRFFFSFRLSPLSGRLAHQPHPRLPVASAEMMAT